MDTLYLIAFLVGGVFVALSLFGGGHNADASADAGFDHTAGGDVGADTAAHATGDATGGTAPGLADLLSLRFLFLFAAFFGLTGLTLHYVAHEGEPFTALAAALVGTLVGMGGTYTLRRFGQERVSSTITNADLVGSTARVELPFEGAARGQVLLVSKGQRVLLPARALEGVDGFARGDEVVVVRMDGRTAEVVRVDDSAALPLAPRVR